MKQIKAYYNLRFSYSANGLLHWLSTIPGVRSILPRNLYQHIGLKRGVSILVLVLTFPFKLIGQIMSYLVFAAIFYAVLILSAWQSGADIATRFLPIIQSGLPLVMLLTIVINAVDLSKIFIPDKLKVYALKSLFWNPLDYLKVEGLLSLMKRVVVLFLSLLALKLVISVSWLFILLACFLYTGLFITMQIVWLHVQITISKRLNTRVSIGLSAGVILVGLVLYFLHSYLLFEELWLYGVLGLVCAVSAVLAFRSLDQITSAQQVYIRSKYELLNQQSMKSVSIAAMQKKTRIDANDVSVSKAIYRKKGYAFFNAMFVARHRRILWKPIRNFAAGILLICSAAFIVLLIFPDLRTGVYQVIINVFSGLLIAMYFINRGEVFASALFFNCDHSMLMYRFYREKKSILKNFWLRFRTLLGMNSVPTLALVLGLCVLAGFARVNLLSYRFLLLIASVVASAILFSFHHLFVYTVLQPYNANLESKSKTFAIINGIFYMVIFQTHNIPSEILSWIVVILCVIYVVVGTLLIPILAPKGYRLRA